MPVWDIGVEGEHEFVANGIVVHNCYRENIGVWLSEEEVARKRTEVTEAMWLTEYELQEPNPEGRAINPEAVDRMFDPAYGEIGVLDGVEIILEEPVAGALYSTGADWAKTSDWTIITTIRIDTSPWRVVAFLKDGRKPWPMIVRRLNERLKRYGGQSAHDNTGLGTVINDYLTDENTLPFVFAGRARSDMLSNYIAFVENNGIIAPRISWAYSEHKYASFADVFMPAQDHHLPDTIASFALAHHAATKGGAEWPSEEDAEQREMEEENYGHTYFQPSGDIGVGSGGGGRPYFNPRGLGGGLGDGGGTHYRPLG